MHELGIALEIIRIVENEITVRGLKRIDEVYIRLGMLSGVDPDALDFNFKVATMDTLLAAAKLNIKQLQVDAKCRVCGSCFEVKDYVFLCPDCKAGDVEITQGEELEIEYLIERD